VDPLPERVRLVEAPGDLGGRELDVLGWQMMGRETALVFGSLTARRERSRRGGPIWAERSRGEATAGVVASLGAWRLLLGRGGSLPGAWAARQLPAKTKARW
jgi:hypothetical protein